MHLTTLANANRRNARFKRLAQTLIAFFLVPLVLVLCACGGTAEAERAAHDPYLHIVSTAEQPSVWQPIGDHVTRPAGAVYFTLSGVDMFCERPPVGDNPTFGLEWIAYSGSLVIGHGAVGADQAGRWRLSSTSGEPLRIVVAAVIDSSEPAACALSGIELAVQPAEMEV